MAITKNPYGVGLSGDLVSDIKTICPCCQVVHAWKGAPSMRDQRPPCPACTQHDLSQPDRELIALREHQQRLPGRVAKMLEITRAAKDAEAKVLAEVKKLRYKEAKALRARDKAREVLKAVEAEHYAKTVSGSKVCACEVKGCSVGPTIADMRAEQYEREWQNYDYLDDGA